MREEAVLHQESVEMLVLSRAKGAWECLSGIPVPPLPWHSLSCLG